MINNRSVLVLMWAVDIIRKLYRIESSSKVEWPIKIKNNFPAYTLGTFPTSPIFSTDLFDHKACNQRSRTKPCRLYFMDCRPYGMEPCSKSSLWFD